MKLPAILAAAIIVVAAGVSSNVMAHGSKGYGYGHGGHHYYKSYRHYKPRRHYRYKKRHYKKRHYRGHYKYPSRYRYGIKLYLGGR